MHSGVQSVWAATAVSLAIIGLIAFIVWRLGKGGEHQGLVRVLIAAGAAIAALPAIIDALQR
jgi:hypothetical protein